MRQFPLSFTALVAGAAVRATTLEHLCTIPNIQSALPGNGTLLGISLLSSTVSASIANASAPGGFPRRASSAPSSDQYCNVSVSYTHTGKDDTVQLLLAFPDPAAFKNRFFVAGGGGYMLNRIPTSGLPYGAASGATSAGYDAFRNTFDQVALYGNGSINWDAAHMFGYQALGELTKVGKALTKNLYGTKSLRTYFSGCSDGGREGWSQIQRWGEEYDGAVTGAPAFRLAQQQVHVVYPSVVEHTQGYYPPPCELAKIVNLTIAACDPLDGRTDGIVARSDLCKLHFDLKSTIGAPYSCAAAPAGPGYLGSPAGPTPAQKGTVSAAGVAVAQAVYDGLHDEAGKRAYLSWQIGSELTSGSPQYDNRTDRWAPNILALGGVWVAKLVELVDVPNLTSLDGVTYDTLVGWMDLGMRRYLDSLQTTWPDVTAFQSHGGKVLQYHGESDLAVPAASSVHYYDSVRTTMYPGLSYNASVAALDDWYRLFFVPGAAHCGPNYLQPGPFPSADELMDTIIAWVEDGVAPARLNSTASSGVYKGQTMGLCRWPMRPLWESNTSSTFECVYDQASIDTWTYTFNAFKVPVY